VVGSALFRAVNRWLNLLPWLVATVVPLLRPFSREERRALVGEFASTSKRERVLDLLEAVGRDDSFLRRTEALARAHLQHLPVLVLFGQFDPMRFVGGPSRYRALFARSSSAIVAWEEHFPFLASAERVAEAVRTWLAAQQEPKS
jgi:pimeloyl-ACP methyl ester carboxylesterase